jgi:non-specific serine/threonine protein kinase
LNDRPPNGRAPAPNDRPPTGPASAGARAPILYCYRFGTIELDEARAELRVAGESVALEQKPLQVLALLLRHPGEVVTREELFDTVWAGRQTVDNVLPNALAKLRKALGPADAARIATLPRVGYRLEGTVERIAVGRRHASRLDLQVGQPVPGRPHLRLQRQLGASASSEVWLARHAKTGKQRVYKFSPDGEQLAAL